MLNSDSVPITQILIICWFFFLFCQQNKIQHYLGKTFYTWWMKLKWQINPWLTDNWTAAVLVFGPLHVNPKTQKRYNKLPTAFLRRMVWNYNNSYCLQVDREAGKHLPISLHLLPFFDDLKQAKCNSDFHTPSCLKQEENKHGVMLCLLVIRMSTCNLRVPTGRAELSQDIFTLLAWQVN